jgi:rubrerythrin
VGRRIGALARVGVPGSLPAVEKDEAKEDLLVLSCRACGDVYPSRGRAPAVCPTCGGEDVDLAQEPLL